MKIGFVRQESYITKNSEGEKIEHKWLEAHFRMAGVRAFKAKISKNKSKDNNASAPDYNIYLRGNENKNDTFRDIPIGALWIGSGTFNGVEKTYMTGSIESPVFGKLSISVWKAEPYYDGEQLGFLYEISTMKDKDQDENSDYDRSYDAPVQQAPSGEAGGTMVNINEDEIPF
jgi:hypothetical protein